LRQWKQGSKRSGVKQVGVELAKKEKVKLAGTEPAWRGWQDGARGTLLTL